MTQTEYEILKDALSDIPFQVHVDIGACSCGGKVKVDMWFSIGDGFNVVCQHCKRKWAVILQDAT